MNLFSGPENTGNQVTDNDVNGNHWGILIQNNAGNTGNTVKNNRVNGNGRAGIALLVAGGNTIDGNDARGNGLLNLAPSLMFDLFDAPPLDNAWTNNQGRFNFTGGVTGAAGEAARALVTDAFGPGGCMGPPGR